MTKKRTILATSALPYANGSIHLGHLVEYLQTDFFVRFQKLRGHRALYICADDTHGTPIMIRARTEGIKPEELIARSQVEHEEDFAKFQIEFSKYSSTHSAENRALAGQFFKAMQDKGHIDIKGVEQAFCEHDAMFLPDRFVKGICPNCGAKDQYGDSCDKCSATYSPTEVIEPQCAICGNTPTRKVSDHLFFRLDDFRDFLKTWVPLHTQSEVANKMKEWLDGELRSWDISRDAPYFGFEIPGFPGKYFYVWLDAPIGYVSTTQQWCQEQGEAFPDFWNDPNTEIYHFIGKDIVYFHTLFWPAMLKCVGFQTPSQVYVHGFLTVNGEKMSKSKGTFISASQYHRYLDPTHLRYYYACKLNGIGDIDLSFDDFVSRVNSDLIGKITNLGSRGAQMINKKFAGQLSQLSKEGAALLQSARKRSEVIVQCYESLNFAKAMVEIREIADEANKYFDEKAPWKLIKEDPETTQAILTDVVHLFRVMCVYLKPILPDYVKKVEALIGEELSWESLETAIEKKTLNEFVHLSQRVDEAKIVELIEASKSV